MNLYNTVELDDADTEKLFQSSELCRVWRLNSSGLNRLIN